MLQKRADRIVPQNAEQISVQRGRPKSITTQVAEATGLSDDTVRRALKPKVVDIKSVLEPESDHDAIIREANAIVSAWDCVVVY